MNHFKRTFFSLCLLSSSMASAELETLLVDTEASDLSGVVHQLDTDKDRVLVIMGQECPISRRMVPRLKELAEYARENDIDFYGVFSDSWATLKESKKFKKDYEIDFTLLMDNEAIIAKRLKPTAKPEAFVINKKGELVYRGRIDNRFASIGRLRNTFDQHDLLNAMQAVQANEQPTVKTTEPVGCVYGNWD